MVENYHDYEVTVLKITGHCSGKESIRATLHSGTEITLNWSKLLDMGSAMGLHGGPYSRSFLTRNGQHPRRNFSELHLSKVFIIM